MCKTASSGQDRRRCCDSVVSGSPLHLLASWMVRRRQQRCQGASPALAPAQQLQQRSPPAYCAHAPRAATACAGQLVQLRAAAGLSAPGRSSTAAAAPYRAGPRYSTKYGCIIATRCQDDKRYSTDFGTQARYYIDHQFGVHLSIITRNHTPASHREFPDGHWPIYSPLTSCAATPPNSLRRTMALSGRSHSPSKSLTPDSQPV